jgi:hypothetical protein
MFLNVLTMKYRVSTGFNPRLQSEIMGAFGPTKGVGLTMFDPRVGDHRRFLVEKKQLGASGGSIIYDGSFP